MLGSARDPRGGNGAYLFSVRRRCSWEGARLKRQCHPEELEDVRRDFWSGDDLSNKWLICKEEFPRTKGTKVTIGVLSNRAFWHFLCVPWWTLCEEIWEGDWKLRPAE